MAAKVPVLIMIQGHEPGVRWELEETRVTTIGRSSRNQINLLSPSVSRFHCEISYINGLWYVADLNSKKGTFLNGRRVVEREVLRPGDVIRLSQNVLKFDLVDQGAGEEAPGAAPQEDREGTPAGLEQAAAAPQEGRARAAGARVASLAFYLSAFRAVIITALGAGVAVGGALACGHYVAWEKRREQKQWAQAGELAFTEAAGLVEQGPARFREALNALAGVVQAYPGHPAAERAAALYVQQEGEWLDREMQRISESERGGDYRDALERSSDLLEGLSDRALRALVEQRQQFTIRLARAAFRRMEQEAELLLREGKREQAVDVYRRARETVGVTELVHKADARIRDIRGEPETAREVPAPTPTPEPAPDVGAGSKPAPEEPEIEFRPPRKPQEDAAMPSEEDLHGKMKPLPRLP